MFATLPVMVPSGTASVLHADLDAFYASVEQRDDQALRNRPVIVGAGVVMAASYEARECGVRSAMGGAEARLCCPNAVWVPPRMEAYSEASAAVFAIFDDMTPLVEPVSVDEAFLDVSGSVHLFGPPAVIAQRLRSRVAAEVGLPLSVGVARTKFLAKVASQMAKPDGSIVVEPAEELRFLHPLPVRMLWGVGPVTASRLNGRGIDTIGELAACSGASLIELLGPAAGRHIKALAHNRDPRAVDTTRRDRTMGAQRALGQKRRTRDELRLELLGLADKVARRLRRADRLARTVTVRFRTAELGHESRSRTLVEATAATEMLTGTADQLLLDLVDGPHGPGSRLGRVGCSLIGITYSGLCRTDAVQLALRFPEEGRDRAALDRMVDDIRDRWGSDAVARASLMGHPPAMPVLARPTALDAPVARVDTVPDR
jgi:DNA polymerase-4